MKKGFTMIELIFVIIIIGILAVYAVPKLTETTQAARDAARKQFEGTLNNTVAAEMWLRSNNDGKGGSITHLDIDDFMRDIPSQVKFDNNGVMTACTADPGAVVGTYDTKNITCIDGTTTTPPSFKIAQ